MKKLSMFLMGCSLLTLLSFQIPEKEAQTKEYLPIDTTLGGLDLNDNLTETDFDSGTY
jgi:hypothetical protein